MSTTGTQSKGTSLLEQTEEKKKKWGGDSANFDIQGAVKSFDSNLAEYNTEGTTAERKSEINSMYGGDITKFASGDDVYKAYNDDMQYINKIDSLNAGYESTVKAAEQAEQRQLQYADTRRQLMQKYLPETLMAQGVANTGYTADALLKAENNYNQYVLGAMGEKAATEQNALKDYQQALGTYKAEQADKAYSEFLANNDKQNSLYTSALATIEDSGADVSKEYVMQTLQANGATPETISKVEAYYDSAKANVQTDLVKEYEAAIADGSIKASDIKKSLKTGAITDDQATTLLNEISNKGMYSSSKAKLDGELNKDGDGKNIKVKFGDTNYKVQIAEEIVDDAALLYANSSLKDGAVFVVKDDSNNKDLYLYSGGKVYRIEKRPIKGEDADNGYKALLEKVTGYDK